MIDNFKYTDKEVNELISSMVILVDTREQKCDHILDYFDKKKINYKNQWKLHKWQRSFRKRVKSCAKNKSITDREC